MRMGTRKDLLFTENQNPGLVYKMLRKFYYQPQTIKHGFHLPVTSGNFFLASELEYEKISYLALVIAQHQKNTA